MYDLVFPFTDIKIPGPKSYQYISASTRFLLTSADELSGGPHVLSYFAADVVGNRNNAQRFPMYLDKQAPETSHSFSMPNYQGFDTLYISPSTAPELTSEDDASGVQNLRYRLDSGDFETYTQAILVDSEGFHSVEFYAEAQVNNREQSKIIEFYVGNTPPVTNTMYSSKATFDPNKNMRVIPRRASIFLAAFDEQTGLQELRYSINGEEPVPSSDPIQGFESNETLNIQIIATDKVQNRSTETLKLFVQ